MIELRNVSFSYENGEGKPALRDINLTIADGEFVVLAGVSGCGKTTLTRLLNGLIPDCFHGTLSGTVSVCGKNPQEEKTVGMSMITGSVFQNPKSQFFNINSRNELAFPLENRGVPREEILDSIEQTAKRLHMEPLVGRNMFHLSGGEKQKIAFASVYLAGTEVMILDEPSSNLDPEAIRDLRRVLEIWKQEGKTVIISEHRFFFLRDLVDTFVRMEDGCIREVFRGEALRRLTPQWMHEAGLRSFALCGCPEEKQNEHPQPEFLRIRAMDFTYPDSSFGIHIRDQAFSGGRVVAVVGHNGAGKSTFLRCLSGLQKHGKTELTLDGKILSPRKMLEHTAQVLQDVNHQLFSDSVEKELQYELKRRKIRRKKQQEEVDRWLDRIQLTDARYLHPMSVSGGQKQRLAIAAAALSDKEVVLFDEPTSGLDYIHMRQVSGLIAELAEQGKLIFLVSHDPDLLLRVSDEVLVLENGKVADRYDLSHEGETKLVRWFETLYHGE